MKVYELMSKLAKMPSGDMVRVRAIKSEDELIEFDVDGGIKSYDINFDVQSAEKSEVYEHIVELDFY